MSLCHVPQTSKSFLHNVLHQLFAPLADESTTSTFFLVLFIYYETFGFMERVAMDHVADLARRSEEVTGQILLFVY